MARTKGAKGKKTEANRQSILMELKQRGKKTPIEFLLRVMWNRRRPINMRIEAAKAAAPYIHRKMPLEIIHDGDINIIPPYVPSRGELSKDFSSELNE